jgi:hypothetical protein
MISKNNSNDRLLEKISGRVGVVVEAEDPKLHSHVTLKFLQRDLENDLAARERFQQEAFATPAFKYPHICTVNELDYFSIFLTSTPARWLAVDLAR